MSILNQAAPFIFPDNSMLLSDEVLHRDVDKFSYKGVEHIHTELNLLLEKQRSMELLADEFVYWGNTLLMRYIGPEHPCSLSRISKKIQASYLNVHIKNDEPVMKYTIAWKTRAKPIKMTHPQRIFKELIEPRFSMEQRWIYWLVETQRIQVVSRLNTVREQLLLKANELDMLKNLNDELPFRPSWIIRK